MNFPGGMNAAQLAQLQQQLAGGGGGGGQQQNPMMNNAIRGMGNQQQQQLQQALFQQQQQQHQNPQGMGMLLQQQQPHQQQQQQPQGAQMTNANLSAFWNQTAGGAMDASQASSAQLAALAGINMSGGGGNNMNNQSNRSSINPAHQMLLGQRSSSSTSLPQPPQQQQQQLTPNNQGMGIQTTDAAALQAQIAQLQRQLQQQQQQQQQAQQSRPHQQPNPMGMVGNDSRSSFSMQNPQQQQQQQQQQQLLQQMMGGGGSSSNILGDGSQRSQQHASSNGGAPNDPFSLLMQGQQQQNQNSLRMSQQGSSSDQDMLLQQQQLLRGSSMSQSMQNDAQKVQEMYRQQQQQQQQQQPSMDNPFDMQLSSRNMQQPVPFGDGSMNSGGGGGEDGAGKSFLDGSFAGGWQSNADLPDRRRIIFSILEVIRQMRPDTNKISQKLPHMAKSLEEHLYRSAQSKEEYLDQTTLKKRLQLIAHGLEVHRSSSSGSLGSAGSNNINNNMLQMQQQQQGGLAMGRQGGGGIPGIIVGDSNGMGGQNQMEMIQLLGGTSGGGSLPPQEPVNDRVAAQKKKVIRQQQQRLLLLRHASKCKLGAACTTKFCGQMMTLWKHMKKCRDRNCKVSHCLSSRCVLNHYRICKSQGRTATCEVCGPVMEQIKRQDANDGLDSSDPLAAKPDPELSNQMGNGALDRQMSVFGNQDVQQNAQVAQQQVMQQLYQQQQQAIQQNQQGGMNSQMQSPQEWGGGSTIGIQNDELAGSNPQGGTPSDPQQLQQLQNAQQKLHQQQQVLQQLQKQQAQLLEQQRQLQEQQQQGHQGLQLQQQHALLQQLQQRCQQQQVLIQQELLMTMKGIEQQQQQAAQSMQTNNLGSQVMGNSSQHSQHSHQSQNSHVSQQNQMLQRKQINQLQMRIPHGNQPQHRMQAFNQNQLSAMNDPSQNSSSLMNDPMPNMMQPQSMSNPMEPQLPNPMDPLGGSGGSLNDLGGNLLQQHEATDVTAVGGVSGDVMIRPSEQETKTQEDPNSVHKPHSASGQNELGTDDSNDVTGENEVNTTKPAEGESQPTSDTAAIDTGNKESGSEPPQEEGPSGSSAPSANRVKPVARSGKGKRLREIADDLGEDPTIDLEAAAKKREASEISAREEKTDGPANKVARKEDDPSPDTEPSADVGNEESASAASNMPKGDVEQHLLMLHKGLHLTSRTITHKCLPIVQQLIDDPYGWVFRDAVDPVVFGLPDYFEVVKNPMHLLLVKKKLENAVYTDMASFERDIKLVFENAVLYNGEESEVGQLARTMMGIFTKEYQKVCEEVHGEILTFNPNACKLCGVERLQFEPPILYCSGETCGMSRIKRKAVYYRDTKNQNFWCKSCYNELKPDHLIMLDDGGEVRKSSLLLAKHDALPAEVFLECYDCRGKVHKICALANSRKIKSRDVFRCPKCILVRRPTGLTVAENPESAKNLRRCKMSDFMEAGLLKALDAAHLKAASDDGKCVDDIEKPQGLCVRVMSHVRKKHTVRDEMFKKYSKFGCPADFPVHTKCIGLFQSIDGVDILLFAMYVYEYGQECPASNRRRVYISYLDSVKYFQPKRFRTVAFQSVIIEYLRWVKQRGFTTAHIWSCPPAPGDEYVFHCHPSHQKNPSEDMLRQWYLNALENAQKEGIVVETTDLYEEYFKNHGENAPQGGAPDPTCLPYFEGDYIPGEIECVVANMNKEDQTGKQGIRYQEQLEVIPKRPTSGLRSGTRSNPGQLVNQVQDKIMNRLGNALYNIKENLIIARLRSKRFCAAVERGDDVSKWPDNDEARLENQGKDSSVLHKPVSSVKKENEDNCDVLKNDVDSDRQAVNLKSDGSGIAPAIANHFADVARSRALATIGSTQEEDEQFESELFESRQLFLNYCQANHCQFDEMRRAKHSTMMVLYQLHNPSAPKFVQLCGACGCDISSGYRYHCNVCTNFDLCQDCYQPVVPGSWASRGRMFVHNQSHTFARLSVDRSSSGQDGDRNKALQGYLDVLTHAAHCKGPSGGCQLKNCARMKQLIVHVKTCQVTHSGGCKICARLLSLIIIHARSCAARGDSCRLPYCDKIRERNERLRRQQLFMDDRRRHAQNAFYDAGED